jgi:hypothetical protein
MKKIIICVLILIAAHNGFSQQSKSSQTLTRPDYLKKSKNQKIAAFTTLGTGVVLITAGVLTFGNTETKGEQETIMIISGLVVSAVSIPFFISSHNNKKKAMAVSFKSQALPQVSNGSFVYKQIPSISFKINL